MAMEVSKKSVRLGFCATLKTVFYPFESVQLIRVKTLLTNLHNNKDLTLLLFEGKNQMELGENDSELGQNQSPEGENVVELGKNAPASGSFRQTGVLRKKKIRYIN